MMRGGVTAQAQIGGLIAASTELGALLEKGG
jgi:hypothetical protein